MGEKERYTRENLKRMSLEFFLWAQNHLSMSLMEELWGPHAEHLFYKWDQVYNQNIIYFYNYLDYKNKTALFAYYSSTRVVEVSEHAPAVYFKFSLPEQP